MHFPIAQLGRQEADYKEYASSYCFAMLVMGDHPPDRRLALRVATLADLDDITSVAVAGFPDDPEFDYRFPYRHMFPDDHHRWTRQEYKDYLDQPDKYSVVIITASDNDNKAVALSVWDISISTPHRGSDLGVPDEPGAPARRRDVNAAHFRQFKKDMGRGFDQFFGMYSDEQIHLWLLCTHPSFRRRGAASKLCQWGMKRASQQGRYATVLASPMGRRLYDELGFSLCGSFIIRVEDEEERLEIWAQIYGN